MAEEPEVHVTTEEARAGETPGIVRWVLLISLGLSIIVLAIALMGSLKTGKANNPNPTTSASATAT